MTIDVSPEILMKKTLFVFSAYVMPGSPLNCLSALSPAQVFNFLNIIIKLTVS